MALDGDCILAAQASLLGGPGDLVTIATTNPRHLVRFPGTDARDWEAMQAMEADLRADIGDARSYLEGDQESGPKEEPYGPTRMTQISIRRRAFLASRQHSAAWEAVKALDAMPDDSQRPG